MTSTLLIDQRKRVLSALEQSHRGLTTIELRELHDVMMPAARVHELRHQQGKNIKTIFSRARNAQGYEHTVAQYVLLDGKWGE